MSKKNTSIRIEEDSINEIAKLAIKEKRSSNYYYEKWIEEGLKKELEKSIITGFKGVS